MKKPFSVYRAPDGKWVTLEAGAKKTRKTYRTKTEAIAEAKNIARRGSTVIIRDHKGDIKEVLSPQSGRTASSIKEARVKHRRSNQDVNIAIAKALDLGKN